MYAAARSGLTSLFRMASSSRYANQVLNDFRMVEQAPHGGLHIASIAMILNLFERLSNQIVILTEKSQLGAVPTCTVRSGMKSGLHWVAQDPLS